MLAVERARNDPRFDVSGHSGHVAGDVNGNREGYNGIAIIVVAH